MIIWTILREIETPMLHLYKQEIQDPQKDIVKYLGRAGTDLNKVIKDISGELKPNDILLTPGSMTIIPRKKSLPDN